MNIRRWGLILLTLAILGSATVWGVPALVRWQAVAWLQSQGVENAAIGSLAWNPPLSG